MISHANLNSGQTSDYYRRDDYYKAQDEGTWAGRLAEATGRRGEIRQEDFDALVQARGIRQGYDIQLGFAKGFDPATAGAAHERGRAAVLAYLTQAELPWAGRPQLEATKHGTTISLTNRSTVGPEGFRTFAANEALLAHREQIEQAYRGAVQAELGRDAGRVAIRAQAVAQVAYDFTLSAPKSVSLAMAQGGQAEADMRAGHRLAVEAARRYMESHVEAQRKVNGAVTRERTGNMICGQFTHEVSRNQDPQLHTHLVIFNQTRCADGRARAIDNHSLVVNKYHFDLVYKAELARQLQERGYAVKADHQKGTFELAAISRGQIEPFSSRRAEILEKVKAWGKDPAGANRDMRDAACQLTREAKRQCDMEMLRESWRATMREHGLEEVRPEAGPVRSGKDPAEVFAAAERALAAKTFAFRAKDFLDEALKRGLGHGVTLAEAEQHFAGQVRGRAVIALGRKDGQEYYCTRESREIEQAVFRHVAEGRGQVAGLAAELVERRLERGLMMEDGTPLRLSEEQKSAVRHLATTTDRFSAVQGLAGTGKTTMLRQAREIFEAEGYQVRGLCFTGKAAEGLQNEAGIRAGTIHAQLNAMEREAGHGQNVSLAERAVAGWRLDGLAAAGKELWIVDEASMVDNRLLRQVQEAALAKGAKVVLTGDARQLQPIGAGNAFAGLVERGRIAHVVMKDIQRQKDPALADGRDARHGDFYLRQAVVAAAQGRDIQAAIDRLRPYTAQIGERERRIGAIARDYGGLDPAGRRGTVIVTGTNADRQAINARVRLELKDAGELAGGREYATAQGRREFAAGDKLVFLKNNRQLNVTNGQVGVVREAGDGRLVVAVGRRTIAVDLARYDQVDHGYCLTAHKAQGITADRVLVHLDTQQRGVNNRNAFYVDISRARHEVRIYTDDREKLAAGVGRWQSKLSSDDFPPAPAREPQRERGRVDLATPDWRKAARAEFLAPRETEARAPLGPAPAAHQPEPASGRSLWKESRPEPEEPCRRYEHAEVRLAPAEDFACRPGELAREREPRRENDEFAYFKEWAEQHRRADEVELENDHDDGMEM